MLLYERMEERISGITLKPALKVLFLLAYGGLFVMTAQAESRDAAAKSPTVIERTGAAIERGAKAAAHGVERGAKATGRALSKASQKIGISKGSDS